LFAHILLYKSYQDLHKHILTEKFGLMITHLSCIWKVSNSNLSKSTCCPACGVLSLYTNNLTAP